MKLPKFLAPQPRPFSENDLFLPYPILDRINNNGGETDSKRLEPLFLPEHRQQRFGFYLLMKAAAENDELQKVLLGELAGRNYDFRSLDNAYAAPGLRYLAEQPKPTVEANKLAQISMYGIANWRQWCDRKVEEQVAKGGDLFILAHATLIGFDAIAAHTLQQGKPVSILKPNRFDGRDLPVGFTMQPTGNPIAPINITDLQPDFERPNHAVLFDDTLRTGSARDASIEFWTQYGAPVPDFAAATDLSGRAA